MRDEVDKPPGDRSISGNVFEQEVSCMSFDIPRMQSIHHGVLYHLMQVIFAWEVTDIVDAYEQYWDGWQERNGQSIILFPQRKMI